MNLKSLVDDVGEETPLLRDQPLQQDLEFFEKEPHGMRAGIRIKKLKKVCARMRFLCGILNFCVVSKIIILIIISTFV